MLYMLDSLAHFGTTWQETDVDDSIIKAVHQVMFTSNGQTQYMGTLNDGNTHSCLLQRNLTSDLYHQQRIRIPQHD